MYRFYHFITAQVSVSSIVLFYYRRRYGACKLWMSIIWLTVERTALVILKELLEILSLIHFVRIFKTILMSETNLSTNESFYLTDKSLHCPKFNKKTNNIPWENIFLQNWLSFLSEPIFNYSTKSRSNAKTFRILVLHTNNI